MNLTATAFREVVLSALDELDERTEPTEIRRVDAWTSKLNSEIRSVQGNFAGDELGERDPDAEDISYEDMTVDLGEESFE
jgi:hypothetical protein